ncbi:hypothetical protein [Paraburkholderia sp. CNPSo 3281]|nr:hypothetical protein [Paraburkholderia sp. CNPSo 3281]
MNRWRKGTQTHQIGVDEVDADFRADQLGRGVSHRPSSEGVE